MIGHLVRRTRVAAREESLLAFESFLFEQQERVRATADAIAAGRREREMQESPFRRLDCELTEVRK